MNYVDFAKPILCEVLQEGIKDRYLALIVQVEEDIKGKILYTDSNEGMWDYAYPCSKNFIEHYIDPELFNDYMTKLMEFRMLRNQNIFFRRIE